MKDALLDLPEPHALVLLWFLKLVPPDEIPWVLTGGAGLRLQGVDVPVNDLDIETTGEFIYEVEHRLQGKMHIPVREWISEAIRSLDGKASVDGVEVEILADFAFRGPDEEWLPPTDVVGLRQFVAWRGRDVPVLPLDHEAASYEKMGRHAKAAQIRAVLSRGTE